MKRCVRCGEEKPRTEFNTSRRNRDGLFCYCKSCSSAKSREAYGRARGKTCLAPDCANRGWNAGYCSRHKVTTGNTHGYRADPARVSYPAAHARVAALWGCANKYVCIYCGSRASQWSYDGSDSTQNFAPTSSSNDKHWSFYSVWPEFYAPLCRKCHAAKDMTIAAQELREYRAWKHATGKTLAGID